MGTQDHGVPLFAGQLAVQLLASGKLAALCAPIDKSTRITWVFQHPQGTAVVQRAPSELTFVRPGVEPPGDEQALLPKSPHGGGGRAGAGESLEKGPHSLLNLYVGVEHDMARGVVDQADRQAYLELPTARLGQLAADQPGPQHVQLGLLWGPGCYADWPRILAVYSSKYRHIEAA